MAAAEPASGPAVSSDQGVPLGHVGTLWRYPVKSMLGEAIGPVAIGEAGLDGDRRLGVVDSGTGMVASAKRPHRWRRLLLLRSETAGPDVIRIHFPDGLSALSTDDHIDKLLSEFLGEEVELRSQVPAAAGGGEEAEEGAAIQQRVAHFNGALPDADPVSAAR